MHYYFFYFYVKYIYRLMCLILSTIVINFFNKQENISLGFLIYLLYLNNYYFNQIMFLLFGPPNFKFLASPLLISVKINNVLVILNAG